MNKKDPRSPGTETDCLPERIHHWVLSECNFNGQLTRFDIIILDPLDNIKKTMTYDEFKKFPHDDPMYLNYDWYGLEYDIERFKRIATEGAQLKKAEHEKKTYNNTIYRYIHYYKKDSMEKGSIIEKVCVDMNIKLKKPIQSTEYIVETFYAFELEPKSPRKLWVYDKILDDLLERGVKDIRLFTPEGVFFIDTAIFLNYGSVKRGKVHIDLDASTFKIYNNDNVFDVEAL